MGPRGPASATKSGQCKGAGAPKRRSGAVSRQVGRRMEGRRNGQEGLLRFASAAEERVPCACSIPGNTKRHSKVGATGLARKPSPGDARRGAARGAAAENSVGRARVSLPRKQVCEELRNGHVGPGAGLGRQGPGSPQMAGDARRASGVHAGCTRAAGTRASRDLRCLRPERTVTRMDSTGALRRLSVLKGALVLWALFCAAQACLNAPTAKEMRLERRRSSGDNASLRASNARASGETCFTIARSRAVKFASLPLLVTRPLAPSPLGARLGPGPVLRALRVCPILPHVPRHAIRGPPALRRRNGRSLEPATPPSSRKQGQTAQNASPLSPCPRLPSQGHATRCLRCPHPRTGTSCTWRLPKKRASRPFLRVPALSADVPSDPATPTSERGSVSRDVTPAPPWRGTGADPRGCTLAWP